MPLTTNSMVTGNRPSNISDMGVFSFFVRSVVYQQNSKESATLQPFFTLQLDIQSEKIRNVQEALETMVAREAVQGYTSKTKQEVYLSYLSPCVHTLYVMMKTITWSDSDLRYM